MRFDVEQWSAFISDDRRDAVDVSDVMGRLGSVLQEFRRLDVRVLDQEGRSLLAEHAPRARRPGRPRVAVDRRLVRELRSQLYSLSQIAAAVGTSKATVARILSNDDSQEASNAQKGT
jgi:DNA invertase Pin-like site-specific DNA recombinase